MAARPDYGVEPFHAGLRHWAVSERSMPELSDDAMLVRAARNGDRAAFGSGMREWSTESCSRRFQEEEREQLSPPQPEPIQSRKESPSHASDHPMP